MKMWSPRQNCTIYIIRDIIDLQIKENGKSIIKKKREKTALRRGVIQKETQFCMFFDQVKKEKYKSQKAAIFQKII